MIHHGKCHCGALSFAYRTELAPSEWSVRADQCSFCRAHGSRVTSDHSGFVEFHAEDPALLRPYRFGQRTADFLVCGRCGVFVGAMIETANGCFAVVSVNALVPPIEGLPAAQPMSFDGESIEQRTRRREARWTPCKPMT
jgi:hypothetical protein